MAKEKIIVSACLLKDGFKYDGTNNFNEKVKALESKYEFILVCPEVFGGLEVPRHPSEKVADKVLMDNGRDVTKEFYAGANKALKMALDAGCKKAILKAKSPSCGKGVIYDGTFSHNKVPGNGVAAKLFLDNGIEVYTEDEIDLL